MIDFGSKRFIGVLSLSILLASTGCKKEVKENKCANPNQTLFQESDHIVTIEAENTLITKGWQESQGIEGYTGSSFLIWKGGNQMREPGLGLLSYQFKIDNPGTYAIKIRSRIAEGERSSESNDVWLRLPDADNFFAKQDNHILYPHGSEKTPTPKGSGKNGWFKSYMNNLQQWSWKTKTSDHDAHEIYATFNTVGIYTVELSGRSEGFAVDRILLFAPEIHEEKAATSANLHESETTCL